jgi:hypothetical protein
VSNFTHQIQDCWSKLFAMESILIYKFCVTSRSRSFADCKIGTLSPTWIFNSSSSAGARANLVGRPRVIAIGDEDALRRPAAPFLQDLPRSAPRDRRRDFHKRDE